MVAENAAPRKSVGSFGLSGRKHIPGGITVKSDRSFSLDMPSRFTPEDMQRILRDCEGVAAILREHPQEAADLFEKVARNQDAEAREVATRLGMTEESFQAQGGGIIWWVVGAIVVGVLVATEGEAE
jgi:hypothetical protein